MKCITILKLCTSSIRCAGVLWISVLVSEFAICGCCRSESHWQCDAIKVQNSTYSSGRLIYKDNFVFPELELEFIKVDNKLYGYLNVCFQGTTPTCEENSKSNLVLIIDKENFPFLVTRLSGGQRLILNQEIIKYLFSALQGNKTVKVAIDSLEEEISLVGFSENYIKFLNSKRVFSFPVANDHITLEYRL